MADEALTARMTGLLDRAEIEEVLHRYTRSVDTAEWDRFDTVFTADAQIDYTESGGIAGSVEEVKAWLGETLYAFFSRTMHTLGQVVIEYAEPPAPGEVPERAEVTAYFDNPMVLRTPEGEPEQIVEVGGFYLHSMVRTPEGWRSEKLHEQLVWKRGM